jgi:hypothetical protein
MRMRTIGGMSAAVVLAGCGAAGGDEATGRAVAAIETVPASVRCVRLTLRGGTRSFDVAGGAAASLALGPQAPVCARMPGGGRKAAGAGTPVCGSGPHEPERARHESREVGKDLRERAG